MDLRLGFQEFEYNTRYKKMDYKSESTYSFIKMSYDLYHDVPSQFLNIEMTGKVFHFKVFTKIMKSVCKRHTDEILEFEIVSYA